MQTWDSLFLSLPMHTCLTILYYTLLFLQVMGFNKSMVATFIAAIGILSVVAQTAVLALLMKKLTCKKVIIVSFSSNLSVNIHTLHSHLTFPAGRRGFLISTNRKQRPVLVYTDRLITRMVMLPDRNIRKNFWRLSYRNIP